MTTYFPLVERCVYGRTLCYPAFPSQARAYELLVGKKTVGAQEASALQALGFDVAIVRPTIEEHLPVVKLEEVTT